MAACKKQANFEKVSKALRVNLLRRKAMQRNEKTAEERNARRASNIEGSAPSKAETMTLSITDQGDGNEDSTNNH